MEGKRNGAESALPCTCMIVPFRFLLSSIHSKRREHWKFLHVDAWPDGLEAGFFLRSFNVLVMDIP